MVSSRNDIEMRITADSRGVATGLAPAIRGLDAVQKSAAETESALAGIGAKPVTLSVNDQAIENARVEIARLRASMRESLRLDPQADTREAQKRIKELQRSIRVLDEEEAVVDVAVRTTGLQDLGLVFSTVRDGISGSGGLVPALGAARTALSGVAGTAAAGAAGIAAIGVVSAIAAKQAWDLGRAAADVQTSISQLDALTSGLGAETFQELNEFASQTPFELDEVTAATKRLVAAGVGISFIPDYLHDIGNVAAATGVPISQLATVFAQMESAGRASYEDLKQLGEAGIPVWQVLSDKLGLSVAELQKMATEGKLTGKSIDLLRESLAELYPTAMQDQAATFNGQMSTLGDTMKNIKATAGALFLPVMQDVVATVQQLANYGEDAVKWLVEIDEKMRGASDAGEGLVEIGLGAIPGMTGVVHLLAKAHGDAADETEKHKSEADRLAASILEESSALSAAEADLANHAQHLENLASAADEAADRYRDLVDSFTTFNDELIANRDNVYAYQGAIDDLATSLLESGTFSPDAEAGRSNWDNLVGLAEAASERVEDTWRTKGKGAAVALQKSFRQNMAQMLIDAGHSSREAWRLVNQVLEEPHQVNVEIGEINTARLDQKLAELKTQRAEVKASFVIPEGATEKEAQRILSEQAAALKPINVKVRAVTEKLDETKGELDEVADERKAKIVPQVPAADVAAANATLDGIIKLRKATIQVQVLGPPGAVTGGTAAGPTAGPTLAAAGPTMLSSPTPTATTYAVGGGSSTLRVAAGGGAPAVTRIGPKQTPVAVYLDGVEIAHRIEARRAAAATSSVRRSA